MGDVAGPLWLLFGTVAIVLLIACTNVASLFSVRAESRRRDFDVRQALGAGRFRLIRTQMSEAVLLAVWGSEANALDPSQRKLALSLSKTIRSGHLSHPDCTRYRGHMLGVRHY